MKIRWFFPDRYDRKWLTVFVAYTLVLYVLTVGPRFLAPGGGPGLSAMAGLFLFCLVTSLIICALGFLGLRFVFSLASAGVLAGVVLMLSVMLGKSTGWEDLVGLVLFFEFSVFGIAAGAAAELIAFIVRRAGRKKSGE